MLAINVSLGAGSICWSNSKNQRKCALGMEMATMHTGTVKSYDSKHGYAVVITDGSGFEVLVSFVDLIRSGVGPLASGQRLRFRMDSQRRLPKARDLVLLQA